MLVQNGTLHAGDIVIAGTAVGRVRAMSDENGKQMKEAGPSVPAEIIGLSEVPMAGDEFNAVEDEKMARSLAEQRREAAKQEEFKATARVSLDALARNKMRVVPGPLSQAMSVAGNYTPRGIMAPIVGRFYAKLGEGQAEA